MYFATEKENLSDTDPKCLSACNLERTGSGQPMAFLIYLHKTIKAAQFSAFQLPVVVMFVNTHGKHSYLSQPLIQQEVEQKLFYPFFLIIMSGNTGALSLWLFFSSFSVMYI